MANKNSVYVQSLVDFLKDTKPYHSKLTEIIEEYRFSEAMTVNFKERIFTNNTMKAAWMYSYFSAGTYANQQLLAHQVVAPNMRVREFQVGVSENTDLPLVPQAFDPKSLQGPGLARALFKRANGVYEPVLEGHDVHQSHGAYTFQIFQTLNSQPKTIGHFVAEYTAADAPFPKLVALPFTNADSLIIAGPATQVSTSVISVTGVGVVHVDGLSNALPYDPTFAEKRNEGVLAASTAVTQSNALSSSPSSAISKISALLNQIQSHLVLHPNAAASVELAALQAIVASNNIPSSYEALLNQLVAGGTPVLPGYPGWIVDLATWAPPYTPFVDQVFASYSTGLYFNEYSDVAVRESGALRYDDVNRDDINVTNISADPLRAEYEEWELVAATVDTFFVKGSKRGVIGSAALPGTFTSPQVTFTLSPGVDPITVGTSVLLTPAAKITIHANAPLEAWSLIKTNPKAYTRPIFTSTRYGYVMSAVGTRDFITVLDAAMPSGTIVLTATSSTHFTLTSTAEPSYTGSVTVNTAFNDGRLAFTIVAGSAYAFQTGDKFYIEPYNAAPSAEDLDLYYGFDMGPYDADTIVYNTVSSTLNDYLTPLGFGFDSRFANYDLDTFNLQISQSAISGRQWRLRALRDVAQPLNLQNSTPSNQVNLLADNDPLNPNASALFDTPSNQTAEGQQSEIDADLQTDLQLWYATSFALEYLNGSTWVSVDTVSVGSAYSNPAHGLSFTLVPAARPFIAARLHSTQYTSTTSTASDTVDGGDVISWTVLNDPPVQQGPAGLTSMNVPHLWIHGDSYHDSTHAQWTLTWIGSGQYRLQGIYTDGPLNGQSVYATPGLTLSLGDGNSYRNTEHGLHWTLYNGVAGLAAGDTITFNTLPEHPTYLVHGSFSGWQADATVDQWYWNGKIGFKISAPLARLFENGMYLPNFTSSYGVVQVNSVRFDAPSMVYTVKSHADGYWTLYRNGKLVGSGANTVRDEYVHFTLPTVTAGAFLTIEIQGDAHELPVGKDLAIARTSAGRALQPGDSLVVYRAEFDDIQLSIKPKDAAHNLAMQPLGLQPIELRYVDLNALSGVPLSATSPETAVLQGWIPLLQDRYDGSTEAVFSDSQTKTVLRAAGTGEVIGSVEALGSTPSESVVLKWDEAFATKYLPLNAEATLVTLGSGLDEHTNVSITEGILFLISGGGLTNSTMFADHMVVGIGEETGWKIKSTYNTDVTAIVADGPFGGFLPGYDNLPYDSEDAQGYYDAGIPLSEYFLRAQALSSLSTPTVAQQAELQDLLALIDPFLDVDLASTTLGEFIAGLNAVTSQNTTLTADFGVPAVGLGMDINQSSSSVAGAAVVEAMSILAVDQAYAFGNNYGFDMGRMDVRDESTAVLMINGGFPAAVKAASTANRVLSGLTSVDGVVLFAGDLVLLKNQTTASQNGVWVASAGAWSRAPGFDSAVELAVGTEVSVLNGTAFAGTVWKISTAPSIVNVDPIVFAAVSAYADFDTPLYSHDGRLIELSLTFTPSSVPKVYVWQPTWTAPQPALVEQISARVFRINMSSRSEFKLIAG